MSQYQDSCIRYKSMLLSKMKKKIQFPGSVVTNYGYSAIILYFGVEGGGSFLIDSKWNHLEIKPTMWMYKHDLLKGTFLQSENSDETKI